MVRRSRVVTALALLVALSSGPGAMATGDELADTADNLDYDVERIYRFVADEIRYEPYVGILRGARGTLEARAGNSVDQALLLAALLDQSLVPYRFATGELSEATTSELIDSVATDASGARRIAEEGLSRGWGEFVGSAATGPESSEEARALAAEGEERLKLAESRLGETVTMIEAALDEVGIDLPSEAASVPTAEVADHIWVQVPFGADWLDLDPTMSAAQAGTVLTPALETLDQVPDDLRHRVEFEVLVERVAGGQLVTDVVLEHAAFADEIAGVSVTFGHIVPTSVERFGIALRNVLSDGRIEYRPTLGIGAGSLVADEAVAFGLAGSDGGGGLFEDSDLFTDEASSTDGASLADGEPTAEWLTIRVTGPGSEPVVARRTVFDRLPAHLRYGGEATLEALEPIELIDLEGTGTTEFPPMLGIEAFAIATAPTSLTTIAERLPADELGTVALAYHGLRDAMASGMAIDAGARTFLDGPNIVSFSIGVDQPAAAPIFRVGLDIWHRNHGVLPMSGSSMGVSETELVAAVTDHLAEQVALEGIAGAPDMERREFGVGALFETASAEGISTVVLHDSVPEPLPYGAMASAGIEEAVDSGDVVVVPAQSVAIDDRERVGWWRIDPTTGVTKDVMDDASGSQYVEYNMQVGNSMRRYACTGSYAVRAATVLMAAALVVSNIEATGVWRVLEGPTRTSTVCWRVFP